MCYKIQVDSKPNAAQTSTRSDMNLHQNSEDLQKLVTFVMPYGKYKGHIIADLPGYYLNWFAREGFPNSELGRLLALMQEIDHNGLKPLLDPLRKLNKYQLKL
jgi:uncharacterized protein (DUF3820 family)